MDSSPDRVLEVIETLRGGAKYRYPWNSVREYAAMLAQRCQAYRIYGFQVDKVWRARKINGDERFAALSELGPPPSVTDYGRCHTPESPIGYCAARWDVALAEIDADLGQRYAIACFEVNEPLNAIAIGEFDYYWRTGEGYLAREISNDYDDYKTLCKRNNAHVLKAIDAFFADEFMTPAYTTRDYRLTSAIADVLLQWPGEHIVDTLVYPSVVFREGLNFAITPMAFRNKLKLVPDSTCIRKVTDLPGFGIIGYQDTEKLKAVTRTGNLQWQDT